MKIQRVFTAVFLAFALLLANVAVARAMPPLPSSFYGTVKLDGANVPTGTVVSARINGVIYAWGTALIYEGDTVYTFDVPGEDTDEPGIQGGVPGDTVVFYIGDYIADQTAPWQGGTLEELNLTASTNRTVVFDANGGTGTMSPQVANAPTALTLNAFARSGYTFSGWNTAANGSGTSYADGATYPFAADATLYAQWTANSYTVTFDANGGTAPSPATKPVTFGSAYGALATTSRTGYAFAGWFTAETGGTEVTAATIVSNTADHTLYAQWTANSYTVTFDANGGTAPSPATKPVTFGSAYGALATTSRTGYAFAGWFTAETGGTEVTAATIVSNTADHTLYAHWTANSYTVTFDANGGTAPSPATKPVTFGSAYGALATTSRTGYAFAGWFTAETGGTEVTAATIVSNTADHTLYAHWTANSYTVTFDANGGTAPSPATKPVTFGSAYGALATTSRTGYAFAGWFTAETGGTEVTAATIVSNTADHTLYAHWTANSYTVTFDANGGTAPSPATKPVTFGSAYGALAATSRTGYAFAGWFTAETGGTEVTAATIVSNTADHTLYAHWTANSYTVTFDANGGTAPSPATKPVTFGSAYGALAATSRTGYAFAGWFTAETGGTEVTAATIVSNTADHTLYAHWTANSYTVTFDANGGSNPDPASKPVTFGESYGALATTSRTGYAFAGWFTAKTGGDKVTETTAVSNTADHTLYAHWTANSYTVTFNANGGTAPSPATKPVTFGSAYGALATTSRTGYAFAGWFTAASGGTEVTAATIVSNTADHTLYAHWTANSYTVTFNANGGTAPSPATKPVTFGSAYGALATTSRTGYAFAGWFTAASGGTEVTAATIVSNTADHTLYAHWTINAYAVTFKANGGTGSMSNQTGDYNTTAPLTLNVFTRTGYTFTGWNTQANGGGIPYANGANYTFIANITLYAQWSVNSYTVTFDANGGSDPDPTSKSVTFGEPYGELATTSRAGFVFNGWFTAASGGTEVTAATIVSNAADHTLYAQWDEIDAITVTGITVSNKVYDGNTNAAFDASGYVLVGVTGGDIVTLDTTGASAAFDNKNAGAAKVVTLSGLSLGGKDAHKYTLTPPTLSADIAAKDLTVSATASNKPYDGSTAALATLSTDALAGDAVTATFTAADFDTADVGAGKTVTVTGIAIEGADAGNYNLLNVTAAATADITAGEITVTADDQTKVANQPDPVFTYTASGFAGTDAFVTPPTCSVPAAHTVPGEYDIVCSGGDPGANYVVTSYVNGKFTVTAIQIQKRTFRSSGAQDGWLLESAENGNKGWTMNKAATTLRIGDEADRKQYRSILSFATGATLPDNAVIVKVTLKVRQQSVTGSGNPLTIFQGIMVDIRKGAFGATSLQITDWQTKASKTMGPFKTAATSGWFTFNLNPSKAFINKLGTSGGVTQIRLRFKLDDNNNSVANYLSLFSGNAPFASRPQLIVEYYIP